MNLPIKRNLIRCLNCNEIIESKHRHDHRYCSCGLVSVDGGLYYLRRSFPSGEPTQWYEELSEQTKVSQSKPFGQKSVRENRKKLKDYL